MKRDIHPETHKDSVITCACGSSFTTTSTQKAITVEICGKCHPFYTGQQKFIDIEGRIDKFNKKMKLSNKLKEELKTKKEQKRKKNSKDNIKTSLKDLLKKAKESVEAAD